MTFWQAIATQFCISEDIVLKPRWQQQKKKVCELSGISRCPLMARYLPTDSAYVEDRLQELYRRKRDGLES